MTLWRAVSSQTSGGHHSEVAPIVIGYARVIPVAVFLAMLFALPVSLLHRVTVAPFGLVIAIVDVLLLLQLLVVLIGVPAIADIAMVSAILTALRVARRVVSTDSIHDPRMRPDCTLRTAVFP